MQRVVGHLDRPGAANRVVGDGVDEDADPRALSPVRPLRASPLQGRDDELRLPGAAHVAPAEAVQGRLRAEREDLPGSIRIAAGTLEPLQGSSPVRVRGLPAGAEGEIDLPVPVDVVRLEADVVAGGGVLDDGLLPPARVAVPDDGILADGHDVELAVAVDVRRRDRIADVAHPRVDLLPPEPGNSAPLSRRDQGHEPDGPDRPPCDAHPSTPLHRTTNRSLAQDQREPGSAQ
jgi:hypothetical protein